MPLLLKKRIIRYVGPFLKMDEKIGFSLRCDFGIDKRRRLFYRVFLNGNQIPLRNVFILLDKFHSKETPTDANHLRNLEVNKLIRPYADGGRVLWCDFNAKFLDKDGKVQKSLMPDYLHPGRTGYAIWRDAVLPVFRQVVGK